MENQMFHIKESLDYKWRMGQVKIYLVLAAAVFVLSLVVGMYTAVLRYDEVIARVPELLLFPLLCAFGICLLIFGPLALHAYLQARYLVKQGETFFYCEAVLDKPNTSWNYRGAVYYTVMLDINGERIQADTRPLFSSGMGMMATVPLGEYNNKKVRLLYDPERGLAYVIAKM